MTACENTWTREDAEPWLRTLPGAHDHKYTRGVLGVRTGSAMYPGAAILGIEAAWRTGLGVVRYLPFSSDAADRERLVSTVLQRRPETVFVSGRTDAWLLGSGVAGEEVLAAHDDVLGELLRGSAPVVADAAAAQYIGRNHPVIAPTIITPHRGEFASLVRQLDVHDDNSLPGNEALLQVARTLGATVMLKGSTTRVMTPGGRGGSVGPATPWLATAGTGDVLAGIIGALAAQHHVLIREDPEVLLDIGLSAALLHDAAARVASGDSRFPITALDVAESIPAAFRALYGVTDRPDTRV